MSGENGNGELAQLLQVKRAYRKDLADLQANFEAEKKDLKGRYLEKIVDAVFGEPAPAPVVVEEKKPEPIEAVPAAKVCSECGTKLDEGAKFCGQCATPVEEEALKDVTKVASAGRKRSIRVR